MLTYIIVLFNLISKCIFKIEQQTYLRKKLMPQPDKKITDLSKIRREVTSVGVPTSFAQQNVDLQQTPLFFPEGFEQIFIFIYFMTLPYISGLFFLFIYVSKWNIDLFLSLNDDHSFILTWAIGYQIIATLILLYIFKLALSFANENRKSTGSKPFRRP